MQVPKLNYHLALTLKMIKKKVDLWFFLQKLKKKPVYQLKGQAPKNKGRMNFKENCDLIL